MIKYFVQKALGKRTFKNPRISICVPSGVTEVEKKAVEEATFAAGAQGSTSDRGAGCGGDRSRD